MMKHVGKKPSTSKTGSPLTDPRPPKPGSQGGAKKSGPGAGGLKPAIAERNSHGPSGVGGVRTDSTTRPGQGTSGTGTRNRAPRT